ncbi:PAS domain S-box-containing protein/diguanylate cyclase (GGDEF) domain-containing protein [Saccharopolyspora antimicrobica]|uniref:PAS domain S-box-containing protein/diguanylate cyclase (GGDEF) domain-containing protein n=1 Tax=Saccharopolyspora antimicrobica TaxID=455193 RepID=A0A1I4VFP3_9PSEU|nr:EAL domain-containing protein [Saccharopolyspora antimicrobica]RKT86280.1 PAS domain S-box-containing protein/diguanylate cyclase (GGDEF)-like protein [Saccharopolyspora antimicrobica]SFM99950.1 PAS domain S-box-containing protein/diguanylate cyclase (GGDEF) domain-containing protein [Saccharopolyspora antimicrobica]
MSEQTADEPPSVLVPQRRDADWRAEVARRWAAELSTASYIPLARATVEQTLEDLVERVVAALDDPSVLEETGREVGTRLVEMHATGESSLPLSLDLLRDALVQRFGVDDVHRMLELVAAIAAGYAAADRESTFVQQETLKRALLRSKLKADRELAASEARFGEVFTTTPIGVAISDLKGRFVQVNPAWEHTLGYQEQALTSMTIHDLFHPDDAEYLSAAYGELAEGGSAKRLNDRKRLLRANGEEAWAYLAVSVLRGSDGAPRHFVTMVEDITELHMLQARFRYQALHDVLTGLPNRQYFFTRLETALVNFPRDSRMTLYHLGLDGFELINDGLGYEVGDLVIKTVARRLEQLVEDEEALVARFGGTEFAILVWEQERTPKVPEVVKMINDLLAEPVYVGDQGIAASASVGVVQRQVAEAEASNMLWAADVALRRAEAAGKRQWALFDPDRAPEERIESKLAAVMPGGLEQGEFDVVYRPLVSLDGTGVIALEAGLRWDTSENGTLEHEECLRLAERSGVTLSLRDWMVATAWDQLREWHADGHRVQLNVALSPNQGQDPDLAAVIHRVLDTGDVDPGWLRLCLPMVAISGDNEETRDNIRFLSSRGIKTSLHDFQGSPEELRLLRELPVDAVRLADELVSILHNSESPDLPEVQAIRSLVPLTRACGAQLWVGGVESEQQAESWREIGCEVASGPRFGGPLCSFDVSDFLSDN